MRTKLGGNRHPGRSVDSRNGEEDDKGEEEVGDEHVNSKHLQAIRSRVHSSATILPDRSLHTRSSTTRPGARSKKSNNDVQSDKEISVHSVLLDEELVGRLDDLCPPS